MRNSRKVGRWWETKAREILEANNYEIVLVPTNQNSAFDFKAKKNNNIFNINVKGSSSGSLATFNVYASNLLRLGDDGNNEIPAFLFINKKLCVLYKLEQVFYLKHQKSK